MKEARYNILPKLYLIFFAFISIFSMDGVSAQVPSGYEKMDVDGWKVFASKEFLASEIHTQVLKILSEKLNEISSNVSSAPLITLRTIPIWVDLDLKGNELNAIDYHPSTEWLYKHGLNTQWAGSVVIANATEFVALIAKHPGYIARVLADGFNHHMFSYKIPGIEQNYNKLKESLRFVDLMEKEGIRNSQPADQRNLFCLLSTIYLSRADHFPFTREDLKVFNQDAYLFMKEIWGT